MDNNDLLEQISKKATETIDQAKSSIPAPCTDSEIGAKDNIVLGDKSGTGANSKIAQSFEGLPIESLISAPIIAATKGQQELTSVYIDNLMRLAYSDEVDKETNEKKTNVLSFSVDRPVTNSDGTITMEKYNIEAPLLSLVPLPAFTMDELTVDFNMEVTNSEATQIKPNSEVCSQVGYKSCFGLNANITGSVSSDSLHNRHTDGSAKYNICARAAQQPPSESMAKLTDLFSQMMEPIPKKEFPE